MKEGGSDLNKVKSNIINGFLCMILVVDIIISKLLPSIFLRQVGNTMSFSFFS